MCFMKVLPYVYPFYPMYNVSTSVVIRTYWGIMSRGPVQTLQHNKSLMHHDSQSQFILMIFF